LVELAGDDLRRYLARSNLLGTAGDILGPGLIAVVAASGLSWRVAFWSGAALLGLYGVLLAASPLPAPPAAANADHEADDAWPGTTRNRVAAVLRDPAVWIVALITLLMIPFDEALVGFAIALLEHNGGASAAAATVVAVIGLSGGVLSYTVLARRFENADDRRVLVGSAVAMTAGALVIPLVPVLAGVAAGLFVSAVGLNLAWLAVQHRSLTLRPGQVGTTVAVLGAIEFAGFWIPIAIGAVADHAGLRVALASYAVFGGLMVLLARLLTSAPASGRPRP